MLAKMVLTALRFAVVSLLSQGFQREIMKLLKRVWSAVQVVLAKYPAAAPAVAVIAANFLARFGFHASADQLLAVASAVAAVVGALVHGSVKAQVKSTSNQEAE